MTLEKKQSVYNRHNELAAALLAAEAHNAEVINDSWRPTYHLAPPVGWMNDPNGLCQMDGMYHVFFQYSPTDANGGWKAWGHYESRDLLHWIYTGTPLLPDQPFDKDGVYSGSAFVENHQMHLFYTGNVKLVGDYDYIHAGREAATIHCTTADGVHMSEKKIVIANEAYGDAYSCHIRDPKVWKEEGNYYMVLGARDKEDHGLILLYQSENLEQWNFVKEIRSEKPFGYMWECPDCFTLEGQQILSFSPQGLERGREKNQNLFQAGYTKVNGNILHEYTLDHFHEWDMGFDFYAQQTFLDESGRRLLIGWMGLPDVQLEYQNPSVACGWQHCLTMVREVKIEDGVIKTPPVEEYGQLRTVHKEITSEHSCETSTCAEIVVSNPTLRDVELTINKDIQLVWLSNTEQFVLQFTGDSGCGRDKRIVRITKLSKIQIYLDHSAMEIYLNDGEAVLSSRFYLQSQNVSISCLSEDVNLDIWELSI